MRTLLKCMGIALAVIVVMLGTLATIGFAKRGKRQDHQPVQVAKSEHKPELIAKLDALEAEGKHADAALEAFNAAPSCSAADRKALIAWLEKRVKDGRIPAMYWLARAHFYAGDQREAAKWYAGAGLTGRIDAARLADVSAAGAIPALETHFAELKKALKDDADLRRTAITWALEVEEQSAKERAVAAWIAAHGMDAFGGGTPALVTDAQWQARRTEIREAFRRM